MDGDLFYDFLKNHAVNNNVIITIPGHLIISSSFLNSSIGKFIDVFGLDKFRKNVRISCNQNIYYQLKKYIDYYSDFVN
jgi:hypothetical protein